MDDLEELLLDWRRNLRARNRAPRTIHDYLKTGEMFVAWLKSEDFSLDPAKARKSVIQNWIIYLSEKECDNKPGVIMSDASVAHHYRNLQQYFKFLAKDDIIEKNPFLSMDPPMVTEKHIDIITDEQFQRLLDVCEGTDFLSRRNTAIIRLLRDCGMRCSELVGVKSDDIDWDTDTILILGKGRRPRIASFGAKTGDSIRRYQRVRRLHKQNVNTSLLIGQKGSLTDSGVRQMISDIGEAAKITDLHPHRFRHDFAHNWLANGGEETDLMQLAGWRSRQMVQHYGKSAAMQRALAAHKRAKIGDRL